MENFNTHSVITRDDYLQYYMHSVAEAPQAMRQRRRLRLMVFTCILMVAALSIYKDRQSEAPWITILVWVLAMLASYFLYGYLEKRKYKKLFGRYIDTNHQENMKKGHELFFNQDHLLIKFATHELQMPYSEWVDIYENQNGIYIRNKQDASFIFPNHTESYDKIEKIVEEIAAQYQVPFNKEENWKWK